MKTYKSTAVHYGLVKEKTDLYRAKITCSADGAKYARQFYGNDIGIYESFFLIMLNQGNNTIGHVKISQGGIAGTVVDPRIVGKYALESLACTLILVHNHPSGNTNPSHSDKLITVKLQKMLKYFDINILDHLILTEDSFLSMADEGIMPAV